jgi:hypothetical protein
MQTFPQDSIILPQFRSWIANSLTLAERGDGKPGVWSRFGEPRRLTLVPSFSDRVEFSAANSRGGKLWFIHGPHGSTGTWILTAHCSSLPETSTMVGPWFKP